MATVRQVNEIIRQAGIKAAEETSNEPEGKLVGELKWPRDCSLMPGLDGAIACGTKIGYVNGTKGWLVYRGYECFDLAQKSSFEETAYLMLYGKLPSRSQLKTFKKKMVGYRAVPKVVLDTLKKAPTKRAHPMAALELGVALLGMLDKDAEDTSVENETEIAIKLTAQIATLSGAIARIRAGKPPVKPDPKLSHAGNYLYMMTGKRPDAVAERLMDVSLILHVDHGMNASTFTAMVTNSSLSDMYSSVVAGIASLKGPLHGGANERVLYDLAEIGSPDKAEAWFAKARKEKRKVMGFGHRVYKAYDPRARILGPLAELMVKGDKKLQRIYDTAVVLDGLVCSELGKEKKIFPNVDFYSGIVYTAMGIETKMFTPIFAASRISGWTARVLEFLATNRIFRPRAIYQGPLKLDYTPVSKRKSGK